jgi:hypothetical protein
VPPGFEAPAIGHFYVTEADGTPKTKRHLPITPAAQPGTTSKNKLEGEQEGDSILER